MWKVKRYEERGRVTGGAGESALVREGSNKLDWNKVLASANRGDRDRSLEMYGSGPESVFSSC